MGMFTNPASGAENYLNQIPGAISPYYQPYIQAGSHAEGELSHQFDQLLSNPDSIVQMLGQGFQQSPGYTWSLNQGEDAINNAASAGGTLGTQAQQQQAGSLATNLANQNYYQYLGNAEKIYGTGIQGEQSLAQRGYGASNDLATNLAQALMSQAKLKYAGQANENQMSGGLLGRLVGILGAKYTGSHYLGL